MDRFVAMIWDQEDQSRLWQVNSWSEALQRQSPRWTKVLDTQGLRVFSCRHRGDTPIVTKWQGEDGIVIGVLFERGQEKKGCVLSLDRREAERVVSTRGDSLIKNYWGNYVALWRNEATRQTTVLRDPCAAVPCFMTRQKGVDLLFAHAEDVANFPGLSFTIDWTFLQAFIVHEYFITRHCGLYEVKELLAGQRAEWRPGEEKRLSWAWNGADIAAQASQQSSSETQAELRATAEACFTAWGQAYRNVMVRVSGGLDSSIVLNLLRRVSDTQITAIHLVGVGYEKYELQQARLASVHAGLNLVEVDIDRRAVDFRQMQNLPRLARPSLQMKASGSNASVLALGAKYGADCFMDGHGGDNLFLQRSIARNTLADYLHHEGFGRAFWRIAYEAAVLQQRSVPYILGSTFGALLTRRASQPYAFLEGENFRRFSPLAAHATDTIPEDYMLHPWLSDDRRLPRGKIQHLMAAIALQNYHVKLGMGLEKDALHPFYCQPITEWALRTPSYVLAEDGRDRAIERRAFSDLIPDGVARRMGKGGVDHANLTTAAPNHRFIEDTIRNGALWDKDWFDRGKLELMLRPEFVAHGGGVDYLNRLLVAEVWIGNWRLGGERAAA